MATSAISKTAFDFSIVRKPGAFADLTISNLGIKRNEMRKGDRIYLKHEKLPGKVNLFDPATYCAVRDMNENMTRAEKLKFYEEKTFELIVDKDVLLFGCEKGSPKDVIRHLITIKIQLNRIQKLVVVINVPRDFGISTFDQYDGSHTRAQLMRIVAALRFFTDLKSLDIVLALPGRLTSGMPDVSAAWPFLLPFYALDTFTDWFVKCRHGGGNTCMILKKNLRYINQRAKDYHD